jgi:hypothetical protein
MLTIECPPQGSVKQNDWFCWPVIMTGFYGWGWGNNGHCMLDVVVIATKPKYEVWVEMLSRDFMNLFCVYQLGPTGEASH